jgi:NAD(P) transhydrogenase
LGEGASELVHLGQLALLEKTPVRRFVEQIFNFPTLAEADRVAASSIQGQKLSKGFDHVSAVSGM